MSSAPGKKQPTRTRHQQEPHRSPAVAKSVEMRQMRCAAVGMQRNWDLGNLAPE